MNLGTMKIGDSFIFAGVKFKVLYRKGNDPWKEYHTIYTQKYAAIMIRDAYLEKGYEAKIEEVLK